MTKKSILHNIFSGLIFVWLTASAALAQNTAFTYQGKLTDSGTPQSTYQMQFALYDALAGGAQLGATISNSAVDVNQGVFNVTLDFGANVFTGANRFLQISVRRNANEAYTVLSPREKIASAPYSIRTLNAAQADLALDANKLGGLEASEYVTTSTVGNSFIKNATTPQTANFNISGNGSVGGNLGIGTSTPTTKLQVQTNGYGITQTNGAVTVGSFITSADGGSGWFGTRTNHPLNFFTNDSVAQMTLTTAGNLGIGTNTPTTKLYVFSAIAGVSAVYGESATGRGVWGKSFSSRGVYGESNSLEGIYGISLSGAGVAGRSTSNSGVYGETQVSSLTAAGVYGKGSGSGSIGVIGEANLNNAVGVFGVTASPTGFGIYARNTGGGRALFAEGNVEIVGTTKTNILQITGGSDLAENFEIAGEAQPGMVVAIDTNGQLTIARGAYNQRVAGIISGANGLSTGMILPNLTVENFSMPVALSGRVWVYSDARRQKIKPGDLLTTSTLPGYAMKVTNYRKAQGAIIGKALTELKSGTGLVLVLVTLQ